MARGGAGHPPPPPPSRPAPPRPAPSSLPPRPPAPPRGPAGARRGGGRRRGGTGCWLELCGAAPRDLPGGRCGHNQGHFLGSGRRQRGSCRSPERCCSELRGASTQKTFLAQEDVPAPHSPVKSESS